MSSFECRAKDFYGKLTATGYIDGAITVSRGGKKENLFLHTEPILGLCFGVINKKAVLASVGHDGILAIWSPINGKWGVIQEINKKQPIISVSISTNDNLAIVLKDGTLEIYKHENGQMKLNNTISSKKATSCSYFYGSNELAYGTEDGKIIFTEKGRATVDILSKIVSISASDLGVAVVTGNSQVKTNINGTTFDVPTNSNQKPVSCSFTPITCQLEIMFENSSTELWSFNGEEWTKTPLVI